MGPLTLPWPRSGWLHAVWLPVLSYFHNVGNTLFACCELMQRVWLTSVYVMRKCTECVSFTVRRDLIKHQRDLAKAYHKLNLPGLEPRLSVISITEPHCLVTSPHRNPISGHRPTQHHLAVFRTASAAAADKHDGRDYSD